MKETEGEPNSDGRFRILVCLDGSDESYRTLRYAAKLGGGVDADIVLLYVRPVDRELHSTVMQERIARENMLKWGPDIPGIEYLKKGRDLLIELGVMDREWEQRSTHTGLDNDPMGDNKIEYINHDGKEIVLKLKAANDIASAIIEQWELGHYDIIMLGDSRRRRGYTKSLWDPAVAEKIATSAPCSVLVARELDVGHGHLICSDGSARSMAAVRKDAYLASRCRCPISLISVAPDAESEETARRSVDDAKNELRSMGIETEHTIIKTGRPVEEIVEAGLDYSVTVVSDSGKTGLKRFFTGSVPFKVLQESFTSVMIVR